MPWNEIDVMTEKERFIALAHSGRFTTTELCTDFGISRKTGHKYLRRYQTDGRKGLHDRSRRPKKSPLTTGPVVEKLVLLERRKHPTWGPKKIHDLLLKGRPQKVSVQVFMIWPPLHPQLRGRRFPLRLPRPSPAPA